MPDSRSAGITLHVVYLARLREAFGRGSESLGVASGATVRDVLDALRARGDPFAHELAQGRAVRVAVNHDMAAANAPLNSGDEVAFFPPVTGG